MTLCSSDSRPAAACRKYGTTSAVNSTMLSVVASMSSSPSGAAASTVQPSSRSASAAAATVAVTSRSTGPKAGSVAHPTRSPANSRG